MTRAYYNEHDPYAASWLRNLIAAGHIAPGDVDERSIEDVEPVDLCGYTQCHFFAGIGVWSHALRRVGWPDDRPVWTGSCPCQPFSAAGEGKGFADERHLWPAWFHLIGKLRPPVVFGEQVASKDGLGWLDLVHADLEAAGYTGGSVDTCAAGVGAPHIRQRLYLAYGLADALQPGRAEWGTGAGERPIASSSIAWLGHADGHRAGRNGGCVRGSLDRENGQHRADDVDASSCAVGMDDDDDEGLEGQRRGHQAARGWKGAAGPVAEAGESGGLAISELHDRAGRLTESHGRPAVEPAGLGATGGLADTEQHGGGREAQSAHLRQSEADRSADQHCGHRGAPATWSGPVNGLWRAADWLLCRDGKWRPVEPGTFPLAHGAAARVGRLRAYGNAINAENAVQFLSAYLEATA